MVEDRRHCSVVVLLSVAPRESAHEQPMGRFQHGKLYYCLILSFSFHVTPSLVCSLFIIIIIYWLMCNLWVWEDLLH